MMNLCSFWGLVIASALCIIAITTNSGSVSSATPASAFTVASASAHGDLELRTSGHSGLLHRFWKPSRNVQVIVDTVVDTTADVITILLGIVPWLAVSRLREDMEGVSKLMNIMIGHVTSALCNYIFLTVYGVSMIAMRDTYHTVGLHICITSGICCINFLFLLTFSIARFKYLFKVSWRSMIWVAVMTMAPPIFSAILCCIFHSVTTTNIQINVLGGMAILCTILMCLTRFFMLVGCTWWALVVATVGIVNGVLWMVHFNHDSRLPYKIASSIGTIGRIVELIILLYNSKCRLISNDIESQQHYKRNTGSSLHNNGEGGGDCTDDEDRCAPPPPLLSSHENTNECNDGHFSGSADLHGSGIEARDRALFPAHALFTSSAASSNVDACQKSLETGKELDPLPPKYGPVLKVVEEMTENSEMSLEDASELKSESNKYKSSALSPPLGSHEVNEHNKGQFFWVDQCV